MVTSCELSSVTNILPLNTPQPPAEVLPVLLRILENTAEPDLLREETVKATAAHGWMQPTLAKALATAPAALQIKFARALSTADRGAVTLLNTVKAGKAPATLLLDGRVRENLSASRKQAAAQLTQGAQLPKADLAKVLATRLEDYRKRGGAAKRGAEVFKAACAACHQLNGAGGNIGPQLDGIANRGIERVVEDILDPNRNVDIAFRYSIVKLRNGQTMVGLKRREVGMAVVFADLTGKETTIPKADIVSQKQTSRSLMPDNLAEILPPADFNALLAYLLREK